MDIGCKTFSFALAMPSGDEGIVPGPQDANLSDDLVRFPM